MRRVVDGLTPINIKCIIKGSFFSPTPKFLSEGVQFKDNDEASKIEVAVVEVVAHPKSIENFLFLEALLGFQVSRSVG